MSAIHIALSFDDNFWAPAYALMRSICLSSRRQADLCFHLLHLPLGPQHRDDLRKIEAEFAGRLFWYNLETLPAFTGFVGILPASAQWPKVVYARLLLAELLPPQVERVIYLDCDMLVRRPIEDLFARPLDGQPLGAVSEALAPFIMGGRDMRDFRGIFSPGDRYFNSGMLVVALDQWRELDMRRAVTARVEGAGLSMLRYFDQDLLNLIFRDRWTEIDWRWNTIDAAKAHEALNPAILHYTSERKPWHLLAGIQRSSAYARYYRHVMTNDIFYRFARHRWKRWWKRKLGVGA